MSTIVLPNRSLSEGVMTSVSVEVAIIGAGTAGCFIASLLDEAGIRCRLLVARYTSYLLAPVTAVHLI